MDFPSGIFPTGLLIIANILFVLLLLYALVTAPVTRLRDNNFSHLVFASTVAILILWNIRAGIYPAIHFHLLGVTTFTLMVGWRFAIIGVTLALIGTTAYGHGGWETLGLNGLIMGVLPALFTHWLLEVAQRRLPHNFFIYIYINGFLAGGLAICVSGFTTAALLWSLDIHSFDWLGYQYLAFFPLMFFSEAVLNGMITTMLVALRPQWILSFDDRLYIDGK